ncbi:uncharacterized protein [Typha angustifolia]|uniref:uncharacterized protein n=1 Tax=Typha angustifolia TaxID=59011 RepID=UPI003C2C9616
MDFHSLHRRDLQALCKKNRVPANMTNVAMADALQALQTVEGIDEILEPSKFLSPKKAEAASPEMTLTSRRTSTRRARRTEERQVSPLPRARRVSVKASEIMRLVSEGEEEDRKQEGEKETVETPAASVRVYSRRRTTKKGEGEEEEVKAITDTPAASHARTTRRRATRKEEDGQEDALAGVPPTPATRCSQRTMAIEGSRTTRRTRQSSRKPTTVETTARRTTRAMASAKMESLDQDEEEEGERTGVDGKNNNDLDEKSEGVQELSGDGEECKKGDAKESVADLSKSESKLIEEEEKQGSEEQQDQRYPLPGLSNSPIRGLVSDVDPDLVPLPLDSQPTATNGEKEEECGCGEETIAELDAEIDPIDKEERETELDLSLTSEIPDETKESREILVESAPEPEIVAAGSSSPLNNMLSLSPCLQISEAPGSPVTTSPKAEEAIGSPAKTSALVGDLIGELLDSVVKSLANTSINTGDPTKSSPGVVGLLTGPPEAQAPDSVESIGVDYAAVERKNDAEKENIVASSVSSLTSVEAGNSGEDQKPVKVLDLKEMSLRKLKVMYKEKLITVSSSSNNNNKVVEGKRLALAELDENIL